MITETISAEQAANLAKSGMWPDYGVSNCQPDVFDQALAAHKDQLENVKIRSCLTMRPRAVIEEDPDGKHFHMFSWHFSGYDRKKHDAGRCNYMPVRASQPNTQSKRGIQMPTIFSRVYSGLRLRAVQNRCTER